MGKLTKNPFHPGPGRMPPHRAGHDEAARCLGEYLETIRSGQGGDIVILYGPRGNGKTALLAELEGKATASGVRTVVLSTSEMNVGTAELARWLVPKWRFGLGFIKKLGAGGGGYTAGIEFGDPAKLRIAVALQRSLAKGPMVLVVDEAHDIPPELGKALLQAAQRCTTAGLPLLLAMAGTPILPSRFRKLDASFWERCERLRIGRLETEAATREALSIPAGKSGFPIDDDALDLLVREAQSYPFFVQFLGRAAWDAAVARSGGGTGRITAQDARKGLEKSRLAMLDFYRERREEALEQKILVEAEAVSKAMMSVGKGRRLSDGEFMDALQAVIPDDSTRIAARGKLSHLGLVWQMPEGHWVPGIPSLCAYIASYDGRSGVVGGQGDEVG